MRKTILIPAALVALAACSSNEAEDGGEAEAAEEQEAEPVLLANGAPAYPGIDLSAVAVQEPRGEAQTVSFETGASMDEVLDFYRSTYEADDYDITSAYMYARGEDSSTGGSINVNRWNDRVRVSVNPRGEGGEFDLTKEFGQGFPAYPGAIADTVNEETRDNGNRLVTFETADSIGQVFDFYRQALNEGFSLNTYTLSASSRVYRRRANLSINSRYNAGGSRVSITTYDPNRQAQQPAP